MNCKFTLAALNDEGLPFAFVTSIVQDSYALSNDTASALEFSYEDAYHAAFASGVFFEVLYDGRVAEKAYALQTTHGHFVSHVGPFLQELKFSRDDVLRFTKAGAQTLLRLMPPSKKYDISVVRIGGTITAEKFKDATGREPQDDDLERCNCPKVAVSGHMYCGWNNFKNQPSFYGHDGCHDVVNWI